MASRRSGDWPHAQESLSHDPRKATARAAYSHPSLLTAFAAISRTSHDPDRSQGAASLPHARRFRTTDTDIEAALRAEYPRPHKRESPGDQLRGFVGGVHLDAGLIASCRLVHAGKNPHVVQGGTPPFPSANASEPMRYA